MERGSLEIHIMVNVQSYPKQDLIILIELVFNGCLMFSELIFPDTHLVPTYERRHFDSGSGVSWLFEDRGFPTTAKLNEFILAKCTYLFKSLLCKSLKKGIMIFFLIKCIYL